MQLDIRTGLNLQIVPRVPEPLSGFKEINIDEDDGYLMEVRDGGTTIKVWFEYGNRYFCCMVDKSWPVLTLKKHFFSFPQVRTSLLSLGSKFHPDLVKFRLNAWVVFDCLLEGIHCTLEEFGCSI